MTQATLLEILRERQDWMDHRTLRIASGMTKADMKVGVVRLERQGRIQRREEEITYVNAAGRRLRQKMGVYRIAPTERVYDPAPFAEVAWLGTVLVTPLGGQPGRCYAPLGEWE